MSIPDSAPDRGALHQDADGAMWAADGETWTRLPAHVARMIHERDSWHGIAATRMRHIRVLNAERDALKRYVHELEEFVIGCTSDDDTIYNDVDGMRAEHGMIDLLGGE